MRLLTLMGLHESWLTKQQHLLANTGALCCASRCDEHPHMADEHSKTRLSASFAPAP